MSYGEPFIGEIRLVGFNFAPRGWEFCNGQILSIAQNQSLFSLLGTIYGGDGRTTFALPDFRGRTPIHQGDGPGLSNYRMGQKGGSETTTLNVNNLPNHNHTLQVSGNAGDSDNPSNGFLAKTVGGAEPYKTLENNLHSMNYQAITSTGGGQSFNNISPYTVANYIICLNGVYPDRS